MVEGAILANNTLMWTTGTGCYKTLFPPLQPNLKAAQYNQAYFRKVKSISAMDFHYWADP